VYSSDRYCNYELRNRGALNAVSGVIFCVKLVFEAVVWVEITITGGRNLLSETLIEFNKLQPSIKFSIERELHEFTNFLDLKLYRKEKI
jgi:hypothetical protein